MQQTELNIFLQSLRGAQPMIVLAYLLVRSAMTIEQIATCTGLSDDAIRPAVKSMASKGLLFKQIGQHGRVTWLPAADTFFGRIMSQNPLLAEAGVNVVVVESEGSEKLQSTSTTNKIQSPRFADSGLDAEQLLNLAALKDAGIVGKKARALAMLPWVTPDYIRAHVAQVKTEMWDNPQGMVIYRIEGEVPAQEVAPSVREYRRQTFDFGKRGKETLVYDFDIDQVISDFMGHEKGCRCSECGFLLAVRGDTSYMCPDCKHHNCECEESEDQ